MIETREVRFHFLAFHNHVAQIAHLLQALSQSNEIANLGDEHSLAPIDQVLVGAVDNERLVGYGHELLVIGRRDRAHVEASLEFPVVEGELQVNGIFYAQLRLGQTQVDVLVELIVE